jgi:hypothetical protein
VFSFTFLPLYLGGKTPVPIEWEAGLGSQLVWTFRRKKNKYTTVFSWQLLEKSIIAQFANYFRRFVEPEVSLYLLDLEPV